MPAMPFDVVSMRSVCMLLFALISVLSLHINCVGAEDGVPLTPLSRPADDVGGALNSMLTPTSTTEFFSKYYSQHILLVHRHNASYFSGLYVRDNLTDILSLYAQEGKLGRIELKSEGKAVEEDIVPEVSSSTAPRQTAELATEKLRAFMDEDGYGAVIRLEQLKGHDYAPLKQLEDNIRATLGFKTTFHLYLGAKPGTRALAPHTDPYDVFVLQLEGSKQWKACIPRPQGISDVEYSSMSDAQLAQLQEIQHKRAGGCTAYSDAELSRMRCVDFTLSAGDALYMPKGIIHVASPSHGTSTHVTISLERRRATWLHLIKALIRQSPAIDPAVRPILTSAIDAVSITKTGINLHDPLPTWVLNNEQRATGATTLKLLRRRLEKLLNSVRHEFESQRRISGPVAFARSHTFDEAVSAAMDSNNLREVVQDWWKANSPSSPPNLGLDSGKMTLSSRMRRAAPCDNCVCNTGCTESCDAFTCGCDDSCNEGCVCNQGCDEGCTGCGSSCDRCLGQSCTGSCDESCDRTICNSGCDGSCDRTVGCDGSCDGSCDAVFWSCDSGCDSSCDDPVDCDADCDSGCQSLECDSGCDDNCTPTQCNEDCDVFSCACNTGCDDNCKCNEACNDSCDECPQDCDAGCNSGCTCLAGYAGDPDKGGDCAACRDGKFAPTGGLKTCEPCPPCPSGQHRVGCGLTLAGDCEPCGSCSPGFYREGCSGILAGECKPCGKNEFQDKQQYASQCTLCKDTCDPGYTLVGCGGASAGKCQGITCKTLSSPEHGSVSVTNSYIFPSTATYTCSPGYQLDGSPQRSCEPDGTWHGDAPKCVGVPCDPVNSGDPNLMVAYENDGTFPDTASFSCKTGYRLVGANALTCRTDGKWSGAFPSCVGVPCQSLDQPENGNVQVSNQGRYPAKATYSCSSGYALDGIQTLNCLPDGSWDNEPGVCKGITCDPVPTTDFGTFTATNLGHYPSTATLTCQEGFQLKGPQQYQCSTAGSWGSVTSTCEGALCKKPDAPENGVVETSSPRYPANAVFKCSAGYYVSAGDPVWQCDITGKWSGDPLICEPCDVDTFSDSLSTVRRCTACPAFSSTLGQKGSAECLCNAGYGRDGERCVACEVGFFKKDVGNSPCGQCDTGYTTPGTAATECIGDQCASLSSPQHGFVTVSNQNRFPAEATYECETGYDIKGKKTRSCQSSLQWSGSAPVCEPRCGDGLHVEGEECDDGNTDPGDGCSATCTLEPGYACDKPNEPCKRCAFREPPKDTKAHCDVAQEAYDSWVESNGGATPITISPCDDFDWKQPTVVETLGEHRACRETVVRFGITFTAGATDDSIASFTTIDEVAPTISSVPEDTTAQCDDVPQAARPVFSDDCDDSPTHDLATTTLPGDCTGSYTMIRNWTATDTCGNVRWKSQTISVQDTAPPQWNSQAQDKTVECDGRGNLDDLDAWLADHGGADAKDTCGSAVTFSSDADSAPFRAKCGKTGSKFVTFTASDDCSNTDTTTAAFEITDQQPPTVVKPADITVSCAAIPEAVEPTSSDICSNDTPTVSLKEAVRAKTCANRYELVRTWTVTDECDNSRNVSQVVTVTDNVIPVIRVKPADLVVECDGQGNTAQIQAWLENHGGARAFDDCSDNSTLRWSNNYADVQDKLLTAGCGAQVEVTFTVRDECDNPATAAASIRIEDNTPPKLQNVPSDRTVKCSAAIVITPPTATDRCTGSLEVQVSNQTTPGRCPNEYTLSTTWIATDSCDLTTDGTQTISIVDQTQPSVDVDPKVGIFECDGQGNKNDIQQWLEANGFGTASDDCGDVTWSNSYDESSFVASCGLTKTQEVTFNVTDACDNHITALASIVIKDETAPVAVGDANPVNKTVSCSNIPTQPPMIDTSDVCSTNPVVVKPSQTKIPGDCPGAYQLMRRWTLVDDCNNVGEYVQVLTVEDNEGPKFTVEPQAKTVECDGKGNTEQLYEWLDSFGGAVAVDDCSPQLTLSHNFTDEESLPSQLGCGLTQSIVVQFTATDACSKSSHRYATFTIVDNTPPTWSTAPSNKTVECDGNGNLRDIDDFIKSFGGGRAKDRCSSNEPTVTSTNTQDELCGQTVLHTVTWNATDDCGNTQQATASVILEDTQPPQIELAGEKVQLAEASFSWLDPGVLAIADECHAEQHLETRVAAPPNVTVLGSYDVVYEVEDACGVIGTAKRTVVVQDSLPPVVDVMGPKEIWVPMESEYQDPGFKCMDRHEGDVTADAFTSPLSLRTLNEQLGSNNIYVRCSDSSFNSRTDFVRTVVVTPDLDPFLKEINVKVRLPLENAIPLQPSMPEPIGLAFDALLQGNVSVDEAAILFTSAESQAVLSVTCKPFYDVDDVTLCSYQVARLGSSSDMDAFKAKPQVLMVSDSLLPIQGFAGTISNNDNLDSSNMLTLILRQGYDDAADVRCWPGLCWFITALQSRFKPLPVVTMPAIQVYVKLQADEGMSHSNVLDVVLQSGILPTWFGGADGEYVLFARGRLVAELSSLSKKAGVSIVEGPSYVTQTRVSVLLTDPAADRNRARGQLLAVGIVAAAVQCDEPTDSGVLCHAKLDGNVAVDQIESLRSLSGVAAVSDPQPVVFNQIAHPIFPHSIAFGLDMSKTNLTDRNDVIVRAMSAIDINSTDYDVACQLVQCTVYSLEMISDDQVAIMMRRQPAIVEMLGREDLSIAVRGARALKEAIEDLIPIDGSRVVVSPEISNRRRAVGQEPVEVVVTIAEANRQTVVYGFDFDIKPNANSTYTEILRTIDIFSIAVSCKQDDLHVACQTTFKLTQEHVSYLNSVQDVVPGSVTPLYVASVTPSARAVVDYMQNRMASGQLRVAIEDDVLFPEFLSSSEVARPTTTTPVSPTKPGGSSGGDSTTAIVAGVVSAIVIILIIIIVVLLARRRSSKQQSVKFQQDEDTRNNVSFLNPMYDAPDAGPGGVSGGDLYRDVDLDDSDSLYPEMKPLGEGEGDGDYAEPTVHVNPNGYDHLVVRSSSASYASIDKRRSGDGADYMTVNTNPPVVDAYQDPDFADLDGDDVNGGEDDDGGYVDVLGGFGDDDDDAGRATDHYHRVSARSPERYARVPTDAHDSTL